MNKFNVGDKVIVNEECEDGDLVELEGVIININDDAKTCTVDFENSIAKIPGDIQDYYLHTCDGILPNYTGRYFYLYEIELVKPKRTQPIKRKGYALWIYNIEKKRK